MWLYVVLPETGPRATVQPTLPSGCVIRLLGGTGTFQSEVARSDIEHKVLMVGSREIKCITFEEILRRLLDQAGTGPFHTTSRKEPSGASTMLRLVFEDSGMFRTIWKHREKEKS